MRTRWLLNLMLLLLVAGLGAVAYLRPGLETAEQPTALSPQLPEQVRQLTIERPGHEPITIVRRADGWQLVAPIALPANPFRIKPLLQIRRAVSHSSFPVVDDALAQYQLAEPAVWLILDDERYAFGGVEPLNNYRYVLFNAQVHLLSDRIHNYLLMSPYDFVSLRPLPPGRDLHSVRINGAVIEDERLLGMWGGIEARRVSRYTEVAGVAEQMELRFDDGSILMVDILQREEEVVVGVRERGVMYHFGLDEGERLLPDHEMEDSDA